MRNLLIFILVLIVVWWARRAMQRFAEESRARREQKAQRAQAAKQVPERMLSCEHCGLHVPESEGVRADGRFFCSDAHRRLGVRDEHRG